MLGTYKIETEVVSGTGKHICTGIGSTREAREAADTAYRYLKANSKPISGMISTTTKDFMLHVQDLNDNYAASPMLVDIARDFSIDIGTAALSVAAYMLPFGLFTLLFGPLGDRYGKAKIISIASFGTAIFSCLGALAFDITSLALVRAANGALAAAILPVTVSYVGDLFDEPKKRMNAIGSVVEMYFLGAAAATAIGGGLSFVGSWRLVYLAYGVAELIIAILMLRYLIFAPGTAKSVGLRQAYANAFAEPYLLKTVVLLLLVGFAVFGSFTYLGDFLVNRAGFNIFHVGLIMTPFGLAAYIGGKKSVIYG